MCRCWSRSLLGALVGHFWPDIGEALKPLGDGFIKLVKMIIAPVIFLTVVTGIAGMRELAAVGPRRGQGVRLFPVLLDPRADRRPDRRQCRPAGRRHEHRSGDARCGRGRRLCAQGARDERHRLPARHHPDHDAVGADRGLDPADAVRRDPVRHRAVAGRRAGRAGARPARARCRWSCSGWSRS